MNKKIKFLATTLCGVILSSGLAFTNVQAASTMPNNKQSLTTLSRSINKSDFKCITENRDYGKVHTEINSYDGDTHRFKIVIMFYNGNTEVSMDSVNKTTTGRYGVTFGTYADWTRAEVHYYVDGQPVETQNVYK
ncbi:hypothetical protein [Clostridium sporogenes]|uniref:Uncharacterized protein n=1 Tax=Clostridium sporogenes TaxID=1509 RepID=A0AAE6I867_CLOSG|nr:hypothetical protein [Clostridium sporogenes]QDY32651.1 hypothetical protein CGS26_09900 [Clostridium sporogenes]